MPIHAKFVLLVEGADDQHVIHHLCNFAQIPRNLITVKATGGYTRLYESLKQELRASELEALGIVVDADVAVEQRWQALRRRIAELGYEQLPESPLPGGTIVQQQHKPTVGVWLMPNNVLPGMLEDFVRFLVPEADRLWPFAENAVNQLPAYQRRFALQHVMKAQIHTWLAWQEEPGTPLGHAITKRYLDATAAHAQLLIQWLRALFQIPLPDINPTS